MLRVSPFFVAVLSLAGCCLHGRLIDQDLFARSTLEEKISLYEDAIRRKCVTNDMPALLRQIAAHGEPAADAMTGLMKEPHPHFPLEHAMIAFEYTRFEGINLLKHEGMTELRRLAESHPDSRTRELAQGTIETIEKWYVQPGQAEFPKPRVTVVGPEFCTPRACRLNFGSSAPCVGSRSS